MKCESYLIEVNGHLDPKWRDWFDGFEILLQADNTTLMRGSVADQPALHGLLATIHDLGLTLLTVSRVENESPGSEGVNPERA